MNTKKLLLCGALSLSFMLGGCFSSDSSKNENTANDGDNTVNNDGYIVDENGDIIYNGAAKVGDFAKYTFSRTNMKLTYEVSGAHFSQQNGEPSTGSLDVHSINGINAFYYAIEANNPNNPIGMMLTKNMGMGVVPTNGSQPALVLALQNSNVDASQLAGKTFTYIDVTNNNGTSVKPFIVTFSSDGSFSVKDLLTNTSNSGCWRVSNDQSFIEAEIVSVESCATYNGYGTQGTNPTDATTDSHYFKTIIKPARTQNGRAGFIVDHVDGSGVGIGLEKKSISAPSSEVRMDVFSGSISTNITEQSLNFLWNFSFNGTTGTKKQYSCSISNLSPSCTLTSAGEGFTIVYNQVCNPNGSGTISGEDYVGLSCLTLNSGEQYNVFIDTEDRYFIAVGEDGSLLVGGDNRQ